MSLYMDDISTYVHVYSCIWELTWMNNVSLNVKPQLDGVFFPCGHILSTEPFSISIFVVYGHVLEP